MQRLQRFFKLRPWQRHSLVLMVSGLFYIFLGFSMISLGEVSFQRQEALVIPLRYMPYSYWGVVFVIAGLLAVASSRFTVVLDSWGYGVLTGMASGWSAAYFFGVLIEGASPNNVVYSLVWGLLAFMWVAISGLDNPAKRKRPTHGSA